MKRYFVCLAVLITASLAAKADICSNVSVNAGQVTEILDSNPNAIKFILRYSTNPEETMRVTVVSADPNQLVQPIAAIQQARRQGDYLQVACQSPMTGSDCFVDDASTVQLVAQPNQP
jgi:hypothetical protein